MTFDDAHINQTPSKEEDIQGYTAPFDEAENCYRRLQSISITNAGIEGVQ